MDNNPSVGEGFSKGMSELAKNNGIKMSVYFIHDTHFQDKIEKATDEIIEEVKMALEVTLKENAELGVGQRKLLENVKSELSEKTSKS